MLIEHTSVEHDKDTKTEVSQVEKMWPQLLFAIKNVFCVYNLDNSLTVIWYQSAGLITCQCLDTSDPVYLC